MTPEVRVGSTANALQPVSSAERSHAPGRAQWLALGAVTGAALAADQLTKSVIARTLEVGEAVPLVGPVAIHHVQNSGIAFGLFASRTTIVIAVTTIAVAAMLWFFVRSARRHPLLPVALGLVLGGSLANLVDRVRLGHVTDFLDIAAWPAFNLADTFIVVGVVLVFWALVVSDRARPLAERPDASAQVRGR
ncbi:MAG: signal peptidase II [Thermoleophilia bacterium]|nr:signal peptidase II [Thermoleophilia bacterium]